MTRRRLLVLGTHRFAPEVLDLASDLDDVVVEGFVENLDPVRTREPIEGLPVHWIDDLDRFAATHVAVCALGTTERHRLVDAAAAHGIRFTTIVHPTARVSSRCTLGEGSVVSAGAVIATHASIGRHVIVNRGALIGHDTVVGDFVTIGPGANVAGLCRIGDRSHIAISAVILDRRTVGDDAVVAAGALVTRDVPADVEVSGVPARRIRARA